MLLCLYSQQLWLLLWYYLKIFSVISKIHINDINIDSIFDHADRWNVLKFMIKSQCLYWSRWIFKHYIVRLVSTSMLLSSRSYLCPLPHLQKVTLQILFATPDYRLSISLPFHFKTQYLLSFSHHSCYETRTPFYTGSKYFLATTS